MTTATATATTDDDAPHLLRIGILGAAHIAHKNALAISTPGSDCVLTALMASRSLEKAQQFLKDCKLASPSADFDDSSSIKIFSGPTAYDELVKSDICDALYIPLPTMLHKEWVIKALQSNKHVLLEKPVAPKAADYQEMLQVAYRQGKYLQDGTMFVHHPRTQQVLDCIASGALGPVEQVTHIEAAFDFFGWADFFQTNVRVQADGDPMGCVGDLGWYCLRIALLVYGGAASAANGNTNGGALSPVVVLPKALSAQTINFELNEQGVPLDATCVVQFEAGSSSSGDDDDDDNKSSMPKTSKTLTFHCGYTSTPLRNHVEIFGSQKWLRIEDFVLPKEPPVSYSLHTDGLDQWHLFTSPQKDVVEVEQQSPIIMQQVQMWKTFCQHARAVQKSGDGGADTGSSGWTSSSNGANNDSSMAAALVQKANDLAKLSLETQVLCDALMESIQKDGAKVMVLQEGERKRKLDGC